ncbi:MAG: ROK family protein [Candidatus Omnitrophica bacterium]|nr:ROK family protein [Candidatus Omnitrophota bacterium]MCM8808671.1 ROK family protein [Candidatus Omnitrophota bacterium]MCM8811070.1 ROK family protein [Candidatus Omnitrophota bacterium]
MKKAVGIDLGGTYIKAGLVDETGKILKKQQFPTLAEKNDRQLVLTQIEKSIEFAFEIDIEGIGIGTPGVVDDEGIVYEAPNLPEWDNINLKKIFEEKFKKKVVVENDVNTIAWGEYLFGAGKGSKTMICITLGTGLGGGIVKDGKLLRGGKYSAIEIGHITIDYKGPKCKCGNIGCIERFVGRDYIVERAIKGIKEGKKTKIYQLVNGDLDKITPKTISDAYNLGDEFAESIWIDVGVCLGAMFASLVNLLNPDLIVIGGGIAQAGKILFDTIEKTIKERAMKILSKNLRVVPAGLGVDAGIVAAASLIFQK